ncbi:ABC transporter permease [Bacillus cereus]|nr:ABC-2 family transporter protein [Bacillus cereus]MDA2079895.1 ABC-2 family transporter protein [Bacillus cereus]MDA2085485.1 ABC-2 family transporter protein [Bacillus cereus]MDA2178587.1 ABC-2 family transporter protein [Bacillus cereus]
MFRYIKLMKRILILSLQQDMEFRPNFIAAVFSSLLWVLVPIILFKAIYGHVDSVAGWSWEGMIILLGTYVIIDSVMMGLMVNNMGELQDDIIEGNLDTYLTKPIDSQFYASFRRINFPQLTNIISGIFIVVYGYLTSNIQFNLKNLALYILLLATGMIIYYSIWFIWTTSAFWWPSNEHRDSLFLNNIIIARFPIDIFNGGIGFIFKTVVPLAIIANPASMVLIGKSDWNILKISLFTAVIFLIISRIVWKLGLKSYSSTGS